MSWWKRKKCPLCKTVLKPKYKTAELRLDTAEGPLELTICMGCSTVLDKSTELLNGSRRTKQEESKDSEDNF